jgi:hypothetical protein
MTEGKPMSDESTDKRVRIGEVTVAVLASCIASGLVSFFSVQWSVSISIENIRTRMAFIEARVDRNANEIADLGARNSNEDQQLSAINAQLLEANRRLQDADEKITRILMKQDGRR